MRRYGPQPIDVLRPSEKPVVEFEAKDGQQPPIFTPNVQTIFTVAADRREMKLPEFGVVAGGQRAVSG